jgi:hypothetical protein
VRFYICPSFPLFYTVNTHSAIKKKQSNDIIVIINTLKNLIDNILYIFPFQPVFC